MRGTSENCSKEFSADKEGRVVQVVSHCLHLLERNMVEHSQRKVKGKEAQYLKQSALRISEPVQQQMDPCNQKGRFQ